MAKVEVTRRIPVPPPITEVVLTMTLKEALAVLGVLSMHNSTGSRYDTYELYKELHRVLNAAGVL